MLTVQLRTVHYLDYEHANSLVNPILYTTRMPDFRRALVALFRRRPLQLNQVRDIPLRDM